jgi:hypothetical protein
MPIERWGTFAVNDHLREKAFVADVLLYDKLVIPYPPPDDPKERERWNTEQWSPAWLDSLLEILGDRVEPVPWDDFRRGQFSDRRKAANQAAEDAYAATRGLLKQAYTGKTSAHGNPVRPVVAYQTEKELQEGIESDVPAKAQRLGIVFKQEFLCPDSDIESQTELLRRAVDLAGDSDFRKARNSLYDWQEDIVAKGYTDKEVIGVMRGLLADYGKAQQRAKWKKKARYAFFVMSLAVPVLREHALISFGTAFATESSIKLIEFAQGGEERAPGLGMEAAAALHTAQRELSLRYLIQQKGQGN